MTVSVPFARGSDRVPLAALVVAWIPLVGGALLLGGCEQSPDAVAPIYDSSTVEPRTIDVDVEAAGVVEPETTVEVKSKASGEILAVHAETGDVVEAGTLLVEVDKRTPQNRLSEAEAALMAAQARRRIAETQMQRSQTLFESGTLTQSDFEQSQLEFANSQAQVVSAEVAVENARIAMDDTDVRAPITGTVIQKAVEPGMVITSPTNAVSGGTVLMQMADLNIVQIRALVDETDIGKIQPGMTTEVTVAAYPNQPFEGQVLKIEPLAIVEQNVTMFAVLVRLDNSSGLLKPGMNADVRIEVASRDATAAVPTAALRAESDIPATAIMLGMPESELRRMLGVETEVPDNVLVIEGRRIELPEGVDAGQVASLIAKRRDGGTLTAEEQALLRPLMQQIFGNGGPGRDSGRGGFDRGGFGREEGPGRGEGGASAYEFGASYWVVAVRDGRLVPVNVETGLTDLAYTEIVSGLEPGERVMLLPSTSLFEQQARLQQFITERFSGTPFQQNQGGGRGRGRFFR